MQLWIVNCQLHSTCYLCPGKLHATILMQNALRPWSHRQFAKRYSSICRSQKLLLMLFLVALTVCHAKYINIVSSKGCARCTQMIFRLHLRLQVEEHLAGFGLDSNLASHTRTERLAVIRERGITNMKTL